MKACTHVGFFMLEILGSCPADIDTATLIFACALRHKQMYNEGGYPPMALPTTMPTRQSF